MARIFSADRARQPKEYFVYSEDGLGRAGGKRPVAAADGFMEITPTKGQARKSARGMPWHQEPMKDVTSCDKLRGAANEL